MGFEPPVLDPHSAPAAAPPERSAYIRREDDHGQLLRNVVALFAVCGGLAAIFLFFGIMGAIDFGDAAVATWSRSPSRSCGSAASITATVRTRARPSSPSAEIASAAASRPRPARAPAPGRGPGAGACPANDGGAIVQVVVERPVDEALAAAIAPQRGRQQARRHARHQPLDAQHRTRTSSGARR